MMELNQIIAEVEAAAQQEASGIAVLETTRFEPLLGVTAERCLAAARLRASALGEASRLLREMSALRALPIAIPSLLDAAQPAALEATE